MLVCHCSQVGTHEPSFKQRYHSMHPWQQLGCSLFLATQKWGVMNVAHGFNRRVAEPRICLDYASGRDLFFDKRYW